MDNDMIRLLSEEICETKNLTKVIGDEVTEVRQLAIEAKRQADAAWKLVVLTRNDIYRPLWKRWLGMK
jgi:hypothetical protein